MNTSLLDALDQVLANLIANGYDSTSVNTPTIPTASSAKPRTSTRSSALYSYNGTLGYFVPEIARVHYNENKTIVWFTDNSKCIVNCSSADKYDRQTAIAYAICKRLFGKVGAYDPNKKWDPYLVDGNGFGQHLQKIVASGFDQVAAEKQILEQKRKAKAEHEAKQKAEQEAAFERRAKRMAEDILLQRRATDIANQIEDNSLANSKPKKILNETKTASSVNKPYVRPNKKFKDFTIAEKREYWREQNRRRNAK